MIRRALILAFVLALGASGVAHAQGPAYSAQPPTRGALYSDGQSGRYLLGGTWLYRADTSDVGLSEGWWRNVASTAGWSTTTIPNAYNAGDFSPTSMNGYVGWYRRDFTIPAGAFASYVPKANRHWIIRFESVNYRATVWLNGHEVGSHAGAYLPWELDLTGLRSGVNRLVVRVDNERTAADLPPGPGGQWWNYGGILREVYLRAVLIADLIQVQVRPLLPCPTCAATVQEEVVVRNLTGSPHAQRVLAEWESMHRRFVKVMPRDYKRALAELATRELNAQVLDVAASRATPAGSRLEPVGAEPTRG